MRKVSKNVIQVKYIKQIETYIEHETGLFNLSTGKYKLLGSGSWVDNKNRKVILFNKWVTPDENATEELHIFKMLRHPEAKFVFKGLRDVKS